MGPSSSFWIGSHIGRDKLVEVHDFRSFLGYVLTDGYNLDVGIVGLGEIYCFPCIPNTRLHNQKVSGVYRWEFKELLEYLSDKCMIWDWVNLYHMYLFRLISASQSFVLF